MRYPLRYDPPSVTTAWLAPPLGSFQRHLTRIQTGAQYPWLLMELNNITLLKACSSLSILSFGTNLKSGSLARSRLRGLKVRGVGAVLVDHRTSKSHQWSSTALCNAIQVMLGAPVSGISTGARLMRACTIAASTTPVATMCCGVTQRGVCIQPVTTSSTRHNLVCKSIDPYLRR